jgi:hypothetical protein
MDHKQPADRKALIRQYKETPRPMGLFQVRNTVNGKIFIGASRDVPAMLNRQQAQLDLGRHPNRVLQADWNALGPDAFVFETLDTLKPPDEPGYDPAKDLSVLEEMWLEKLFPFGDRGYNVKPKPAEGKVSPAA